MDIKEFISRNDQFAQHLGIELLEVSRGKALAKMLITEKHLNSVNIVHGGAIFSLGDLAFAAASNSHGNVALGINVNISFMSSSEKSSTLIAHAYETSRNFKLATYTVDIKNELNELVAQFNGMVYRKKDKHKL